MTDGMEVWVELDTKVLDRILAQHADDLSRLVAEGGKAVEAQAKADMWTGNPPSPPGEAQAKADMSAGNPPSPPGEAQDKADMSAGNPPSPPGKPPAVRTGFLRASIRSWLHDRLTARIGPGAEYGLYLEFGTRKMAARPFMRPALAKIKPKFEEMVQQAVGRWAP